jgi:hypothetical protein
MIPAFRDAINICGGKDTNEVYWEEMSRAIWSDAQFTGRPHATFIPNTTTWP